MLRGYDVALKTLSTELSLKTAGTSPGSFFVRELWNLKFSTLHEGLAVDCGLVISVGALCFLWLGLVMFGWARWGDVTVDSGRDLYVAVVLTEGNMLYRDVWYLYGPGAPYFNSLLFRIFGTHINVAYIAGALAGLVVALTLFRCALYFASLPVAFATGYVVLIQSFGLGIFTYPLPYAYASVYGSVAACLFLLYAVRSAINPTKMNLLWAGLWSATALLMKLEFGFACFSVLAVLHIGLALRQRSWRASFRNLLTVTPAVFICAVVIAWLVSIGGVSFITQENFMSWPTSYFMEKYGQDWLRFWGYDPSLMEVLTALLLTIGFVAFWVGVRFWLMSIVRKLSPRNIAIAIALVASAIAFWMARPERLNDDLAKLLFPRQMVFIVALAVPLSAFLFWRSGWSAENLANLVLMSFGPLLAFRILFRMRPLDYAIFYNGPVLLAFFLLWVTIAVPSGDTQSGTIARGATLFLCAVICIWVTVQVYPHYRDMRTERVAFENERGTIYLQERMLPAWAEAVDFMRGAKRRGEAVMSVPEDTALYFFAGVTCPTRLFAFTPGLLAPGRMTDKLIGEMEAAPVRYVIWSNRRFTFEYGVPEFGVDFDLALGDYIRRNYRPVRKFSSSNRPNAWQATLWERAGRE